MRAISTLPSFSIELEGELLSEADLLWVEEIVVAQKLSAPAVCEVSFVHPTRDLTSCGKSLRIFVGTPKTLLFSGDVTAVEFEYDPGGRKIRVRAYDQLARLRKQFPIKAHVQVGLKDLANEMVRDLGIKVEGSEDTPLWQRFIQHRQSNLDCLLDLADRAGLLLTLRDDVLHLLTLAGDGSTKKLKLGEDLLEASLVINQNEVCDSAAVQGWDPSHVSKNEGSASNPRVVRRSDAAEDASAYQQILVHEPTPDPLCLRALRYCPRDGTASRLSRLVSASCDKMARRAANW